MVTEPGSAPSAAWIARVKVVGEGRIAELVMVEEVGKHDLESVLNRSVILNIFFTLKSTFQ